MAMKQPRKSGRYTLKIVVVVLFLIILAGIIAVYQLYNRHEYLLELGQKIQINEYNKILWMEDEEKILVQAKLAVTIPDMEMPRDCSLDKTRAHHICLEWKNRGEIGIEYLEERDDATCYLIEWTSKEESFTPKDCFYMDDANWYGGGLLAQQDWPMGRNNISERPFVTGRGYRSETFGPVVDPYWLSSNGISIIVDQNVPLHVSIGPKQFDLVKTKKGSGEDMTAPTGRYLCLMADAHRDPYKKTHLDQPSVLNYTVCWSKSIQEAHRYAIGQITGMKDLDVPEFPYLGKPVWSTDLNMPRTITQDLIMEHVEALKKHEYDVAVFLIKQGWEGAPGDMTFDSVKFPDEAAMLQKIAEMGINVSLSVHPYVSTHSSHFEEAIEQDFLVMDAGGQAPGLTAIWAGPERAQYSERFAGVLDLKNDSATWFRHNVNATRRRYGIDSFLFDGGDVDTMPFQVTFSKDLKHPNMYTHRYGDIARSFGNDVLVATAYRAQLKPALIALPSLESTWNALQTIIPTMLQLSTMGYPFVVPPSVGGTATEHMPEEELFLRWMELSIFFPVIHFQFMPHKLNAKSEEFSKLAVIFHHEYILPYLAMRNDLVSKPFIRPLWFIENSEEAYTIKDEFLLGDTLLVAPVVFPGITKRNIYFPKGSWLDHRSSIRYTGPKWVYEYRAPLGTLDVPYFTKVTP